MKTLVKKWLEGDGKYRVSERYIRSKAGKLVATYVHFGSKREFRRYLEDFANFVKEAGNG